MYPEAYNILTLISFNTTVYYFNAFDAIAMFKEIMKSYRFRNEYSS